MWDIIYGGHDIADLLIKIIYYSRDSYYQIYMNMCVNGVSFGCMYMV